MGCNWNMKVRTLGMIGCFVSAAWANHVLGQGGQHVAPQEVQQAEAQLMEAAKTVGPWDQQLQFIEQATDNFFTEQNWNSQEDAWARQLMREVGQVPPWEPVRRQEVFLNSLQSRYNLSHDQRQSLNGDLQRETMMLTFKHIKDIVPIATDIARTRAQNQPFTPEQVQQWSAQLKPLMNDGMQAIQRVSGRLDQSMTPEQRRILQADMKAFQRRHHDMEKMVEKWQSGNWKPQDWGLQNDPVHAEMAARYSSQDAQRSDLVRQAQAASHPNEKAIAVNDSEWDAYVKWFCKQFECDERQRTQAESILKSSKQEAINYRNGRGNEIAKYEKLLATAQGEPRRAQYQAELDRLAAPIGEIFNQMKRRLMGDVLTTQQRSQLAPAAQAAAPKK